MANPFTVQPLGGLQSVANIQQGMQGIAQNFQEDAAEEKRQALMSQASEIMERGNPQEIAQFSMQNPEVGESMMGGIKFANEATRSNMRDSMQRIIAGEDPERVIAERAQMVEAQGGDPSDTLRELERVRQDPDAYRKQVENVFAMSYPKEYEAFSKATGKGGGPKIGTYNPRDYTPQSFSEFTKTGDPAVLERYASQRSVDIGGVPHVFDPARGGYYPASVSGGGQQRPVTSRDVAESEAEITRGKESAKQDVKAQSPAEQREQRKAIKETRSELMGAEDTLGQIDNILGNEEYIDALTGVRGKVPGVPGTPGFDAEVAFDRLKNSLTLENLGKMSGVLSESDIKILSSEAGGIEPGMSREALIGRMNRIREVLEGKSEDARRRLREMMEGSPQEQQQSQGMSEEDADAFIDSILGQ